MKPTLQTVAADIARRIPAMKTDSSLNNEQLIAGMIEPLLESEDEDDNGGEIVKAFYVGILLGFLLVGLFIGVIAILN